MNNQNGGQKRFIHSRLFGVVNVSNISRAKKPFLLSVALVAIASLLTTSCKQKLKSDTGIEASNLIATYTQLQQAIKNQDFQAAYMLMNTSYQTVNAFNVFEAGHKTVPNYYPLFSSNSIVTVAGDKGEIMIATGGQEEHWNVYSFKKEGQAWRCTGDERILTVGWD